MYNETWIKEWDKEKLSSKIIDALEIIWSFIYCYWHYLLLGLITLVLMYEYLGTGNHLIFLVIMALPFLLFGFNRMKGL